MNDEGQMERRLKNAERSRRFRMRRQLQSDAVKAFIQSTPETSGMNDEEILLKYKEMSKKLIHLTFVLL